MNPADLALATTLMWTAVAEAAVGVPTVIAIGVTANAHFSKWLVLRSRGVWYVWCLTWGALVQIALSLAVAVTCVAVPWAPTSLGLAILTVVEEVVLFFLTGVLIARQVVLALIFRTLPCHRRNSTATPLHVTPLHFLIVPTVVAALWLACGAIPEQLLVYGLIAQPLAIALVYAYTVAIIVVYCVPAVANRRIPMTLFCDFYSNIATFALMVVLGVAISIVNSFVLFPAGDVLSYHVARSCTYIALVGMYAVLNLLRPVWAVWRDDLAYLKQFEQVGHAAVQASVGSKSPL